MLSASLKILPGITNLSGYLSRASNAFSRTVTVDGGKLSWQSRSGSSTGVPGNKIVSVIQDGASFVVQLQPSSHRALMLTFGTGSKQAAAEWVTAIQGIVGQVPPLVATATAETILAASPEVSTVTVSVEVEGSDTRTPELLVVACDPRGLEGVLDLTAEERAIFDNLENFTFHTSLLKVRTRTGKKPEYGVIFAPDPLDELDGSFYGFRNESAKQFGQAAANEMEENLVTTYQLRAGGDWTEDQFAKVLEAQVRACTWWPFEKEFEVIRTFTTPYFNHFKAADLVAELPWRLLELQGKLKTLYVHASTCFESALHCWSYASFMLDEVPAVHAALPADNDAPIVILGAGVSGLLFASRLKGMGYTNVEILEATTRYGGKTVTHREAGPYPPGSKEDTVCELGTCYMSPAYDPMVEAFEAYLQGNERFDFTKGLDNFRGIVSAGEFPEGFDVFDDDGVLDFNDYVILKAAARIDDSNNPFRRKLAEARGLLDIVYDLSHYALLHLEHMGLDMPMPRWPNATLRATFQSMTLMDFLREHELESMVGVLQYSYQVQGYGVLEKIPAYYGLLWITPAITWAILRNGLNLSDEGVTAWSRGWGDLWDQIVEKDDLRITTEARVTRITRSVVA